MPIESCVLYVPEEALVLRENHMEIWEGIPKDVYPFSPAESRGGALGLRAEGSGHYIWVDPTSCDVLTRDPRALFVVRGSRRPGGIRFWSVSSSYESPPWPPRSLPREELIKAMIAKAKEMNVNKLWEVQQREQKEKRKKDHPVPDSPPTRSHTEVRQTAYDEYAYYNKRK